MPRLLEGKTALVTGASGGIGSAIARLFADHGCSVGVHFSSNRRAAEDLMRELPRGPHALFRADLTKESDCLALAKKSVSHFGSVDILVNNAGAVFGPADLESISLKDWNRTFQLNATAAFILSRALFPRMRKRHWGRMINISSIGVKFGGFPRSAHYAASKAALECLTTSFARAGAEHGILVNTIRCGVIDTPFHDKAPKDMKKRIAMIPVKRIGTAADVAKMALHLASSSGDFITGQTLGVTGGE